MNTHPHFSFFRIAVLVLIASAPAGAAETRKPLQPYVLSECIVSGQKLEADAFTFKYEGREIKTCCDMCMDEFFKDPELFVQKIEEAERAAAKSRKNAKAAKPKKP